MNKIVEMPLLVMLNLWVTKNLGIAITKKIPGLTNIVTPLLDATNDSTLVVDSIFWTSWITKYR